MKEHKTHRPTYDDLTARMTRLGEHVSAASFEDDTSVRVYSCRGLPGTMNGAAVTVEWVESWSDPGCGWLRVWGDVRVRDGGC